MIYTYIVPCLFGIESLAGDELKELGASNVSVRDGSVRFDGDESMLAKALINLRYGERILIKVGEFRATTFEELFQGVKAVPWESFVGKKDSFPVKGYSIKSKLFSVPDCQSIVKKAVVERLKLAYNLNWFEESSVKVQIQFAILNDTITVSVDATGTALHKRGYRTQGNAAPIRETLAAAMIRISRFRDGDTFCDPLCGSGTIAIEAAMAAANMAPGINRIFDAESFTFIPKAVWQKARSEALSKIKTPTSRIFASDIDPAALELSIANAKRANVDKFINFSQTDVAKMELEVHKKEDGRLGYGKIICNPPYGERMFEIKEAESLYRTMGQSFGKLKGFQCFIITSHEGFEGFFGHRADKKRKLYNGMIKCDLYQYINLGKVKLSD